MASAGSGSPGGGLALEGFAVGPCCVLEGNLLTRSPSQTPRPSSPKLRQDAEALRSAMRSNNRPFVEELGPWSSTSLDDMSQPPADDMSNWSTWMEFDPAATSQSTQNVDDSHMDLQGPACLLRPAQRQSPTLSRHQQAPAHSHAIPASGIPTSVPMYSQHNGVPFTFGQNMEAPSAFNFNSRALSSPADAVQHTFFTPSAWQQQEHRHQQQQQYVTDNSLYPDSRFDQTSFTATPSLHHSPASPNHGHASSSSSHSSPPFVGDHVTTEPIKKKRKAQTEEDDDELDMEPELEPESAGRKAKGPPPKKTSHNMIEKRYRNNLNDKIAALRDSVPSLRSAAAEEDDASEDLQGLTRAHKLNKATVLSKATEYIRFLEKLNKQLRDELTTYKTRVKDYEKAAISGPRAMHGSMGTPDPSRYQDEPFTPTHGQQMRAPQGMIPVPDNISALQRGLPPQQHYAHAYPQFAGGARHAVPGTPMVPGRPAGSRTGKLMIGALAGLMVLEGVAEHEKSQEQSDGRALFALPVNLAGILTPRVSLGVASVQFPLAKGLLVFGALLYLIAPLLDFKAKPKRKATSTMLLSRAPSLASPLEVRRNAWLTAIQTVWVPQHSFLLELAALGLKALKLSSRKIIGWERYAYLTGITQDQEAARIKAWEIALDAQLTGGDAEISKSRLWLTLMASFTLPATPARFMLTALHIRVLLGRTANSTHGSWSFLWPMLDKGSAIFARVYWKSARSEHRLAATLAYKEGNDAKPLPDHLAALIERELDEVLVVAIVQRAYNLTWNRPSAENTIADPSADGVVEDFAICSPLDALAAWHSSLVLNQGLIATLATDSKSPKEGAHSELHLALRAAPPNSQAQLRALVAQAVVLDDDREARIRAALDALPSTSSMSDTTLKNIVENAPVAPDVRKALTLVKCLSLISCASPAARHRAIFVVNNTYLPEVTTTLLSFVAAYKVLTLFMENKEVQADASVGLERIASTLRMWVGHDAGKQSGLGNKSRIRIVSSCLAASKILVGLQERDDTTVDVDDGYVSASVKDD